MTAAEYLLQEMGAHLRAMVTAMRDHYSDTPQWSEADEEAMEQALSLAQRAENITGIGGRRPLDLLVTQIIGFCEGDAASEDIDAVRDTLSAIGIRQIDVHRIMLAMRGMYVPGNESIAEVLSHTRNPIPRSRLCVDEGCPHHGTPHECVDRNTISVNARDLHAVLAACVGHPHEIRELEATRGVCKINNTHNPLQALLERYHEWVNPTSKATNEQNGH